MSLFGAALYRTGTLAIDAGAWSVAVVSLSRAIDAGMALLIASRDHPAAFEVDGIDLVRHSLQMRNHALNQEIDTPIRADDQQFVVDLNRRTLELHPNDEDRARLGHSLAKLVFARGRLVDELDIAVDRQLVEEARQLLNATIEDDDARILLETADALVCVMEGVTDAAIAALQRARASTKPGPMIAEATAQLAVILIDAGRLAEASQLAAGLNGDDDSPVVQMALAAMALAENDRTAARSRLRSALLWSSVRSGPHGTVRALLRTAVSALDDEVAIAGHIEVTLLELDRLYLVTGLADDAERIVHGDSGEQRVAAEDLVERLLSQDLNDDAFALADDTRATVLRRRLLATEANERRPSAIRPPSTTITEFDHTRFFWEYSRYLRTEVRDALVASGYPTTPSFSDLRRVIRGCGRQVLLVQPIRDRVHLLLVDPDGEVSASVSPMARDDLWRHAKRVGQHFGIANVKLARGENPYLEALDDALRTSSESLAALHDALIEPVAPRLSNLPLILIPPGDMPIVPWNAIGTMDEPLINRSALSIAPSIATLGICRERRVERALPASAVVFADPQVAPEHHLSSLPGARSEGDDVASFLRGAGMADALVLQARGADATEAAFQSIVDAEFVHLACHAIVRDPVSMSGLYLTPGMADGVLTPPEIAEIDLSDAFVFLSACETGAGAPTLDGVLGIARAFLEAGARTVVMSAWKVEDNATRVLVQHFYRQFFGPDRPPVDVALANAIRALRAGLAAGRVRATTGTVLPDDPAIWAPFHALGDGSFSYG